MKQLHIRHQTSVADPLRQERLRRALAIIMEHQEEASCKSHFTPASPPPINNRKERSPVRSNPFISIFANKDGVCYPRMSI